MDCTCSDHTHTTIGPFHYLQAEVFKTASLKSAAENERNCPQKEEIQFQISLHLVQTVLSLTTSYISRHHVFYKICQADFREQHGGKNVTKYANSAQYRQAERAPRGTPAHLS